MAAKCKGGENCLQGAHDNYGDKGSSASKNLENDGKRERFDMLQSDVEMAMSEISKSKIQSILDQVNLLLPTELLLLYLKLPTDNKEPVDPLRQSLNPLGSRSEINQTISWIKTHLEEDPDISLQKKGVYEEYKAFCELNNIKSLSTADFGKVMKQVYPRVRPRRLGTRGNSQYCYSGLRKRIKLPTPILPDLSEKPLSTESLCARNDIAAAAWTIVKEWAEIQLGIQFVSLHSLAFHLVVKCSIGVGTVAASIITSADNIVKSEHSSPLNCSNSHIYVNRHKEMTMQLQKKLQQKNETTGSNREHKRKIQNQSSKSDTKQKGKKCKIQPPQLPTSTSSSPLVLGPLTPGADSTCSSNGGLTPTQLSQSTMLQQQTVCDKSIGFTAMAATSTPANNNQMQTLPNFSSFQKQQSIQEAAVAGSVIGTRAGSATLSPGGAGVGSVNTGMGLASVGVASVSTGVVSVSTGVESVSSNVGTVASTSGLGESGVVSNTTGSVTVPLSQVTTPKLLNVTSQVEKNPQVAGILEGKVAIPRLLPMKQQQSSHSPPKKVKGSYKAIQPKPALKSASESCDMLTYNPQMSQQRVLLSTAGENRSQLQEQVPLTRNVSRRLKKMAYSQNIMLAPDGSGEGEKKDIDCDVTPLGDDLNPIHFSRERLISISKVSKDDLDDYLGASSSQENEEELMKYFENNGQSELVPDNNDSTVLVVTEQDQTTKQLSQVRQLLEQKFVSNSTSALSAVINKSVNYKSIPNTPILGILPPIQGSGSARRRVSFDTHNTDEPVPPSPNTRCKNLNFTPISPGPKSPNGRHSKCSSTNASPFVSPRNTPVPRARGNSHPYPNQNVPVGLLNVAATRKQMKGNKVKPDIDLKLVSESSFKTLPMSAPPSPKMNLLQNLLQSKISYTPDYVQQVLPSETASPEMNHLVSETHFRSQSVPLPNFPTTSNYTHFSFDLSADGDPNETSNEFNDLDAFSASENINVNKIIDAIDNSQLETILDNNRMELEQADFGNVSNPIGENLLQQVVPIEYSISSESKCDGNLNPEISEVRWENRTQIENLVNSMKCPSSRSVPVTPISHVRRKITPVKLPHNQNSRSYPSTPLTNETFSYSPGHDYLLNGQPIKEKSLSREISFGQDERRVVYGEILNENSGDVLITDNKGNYNIEGQIGAEEGCDLIGTEFFEGVPDINGN